MKEVGNLNISMKICKVDKRATQMPILNYAIIINF